MLCFEKRKWEIWLAFCLSRRQDGGEGLPGNGFPGVLRDMGLKLWVTGAQVIPRLCSSRLVRAPVRFHISFCPKRRRSLQQSQNAFTFSGHQQYSQLKTFSYFGKKSVLEKKLGLQLRSNPVRKGPGYCCCYLLRRIWRRRCIAGASCPSWAFSHGSDGQANSIFRVVSISGRAQGLGDLGGFLHGLWGGGRGQPAPGDGKASGKPGALVGSRQGKQEGTLATP